jgi:hypothetical protein
VADTLLIRRGVALWLVLPGQSLVAQASLAGLLVRLARQRVLQHNRALALIGLMLVSLLLLPLLALGELLLFLLPVTRLTALAMVTLALSLPGRLSRALVFVVVGGGRLTLVFCVLILVLALVFAITGTANRLGRAAR